MRSLKLLPAVAIGAYFLYFAAGSLFAAFAADDMMNLGGYFLRGFWNTVADNVRFWSTAYRPLGGLFYLPIYSVFGLNPLPYHAAALALLALNVGLTYYVARLVSGSRAAAAVAAVTVTAHAGMADLYYNISAIYDVLAYTFTLLLLALYVRIRSQGRSPSTKELVAMAFVFICGLNGKEIAVAGAGFVLAYEVFIPKTPEWRGPAVFAAIALAYTAGKLWGPDPISATPGYHLEFSLARYVVNNTVYVNEILGRRLLHNAGQLAVAGLGLTALCCWRRPLRWAWFLIVTAVLPISFIPTRAGGSLYLPLFGWAMLVALIAALPRRTVCRVALSTLLALGIAADTLVRWRGRPRQLLEAQRLTSETIRQTQALALHPRPHSRVIFLNDRFEGWDVLFIAQLVWGDPTIEITLAEKTSPKPSEEELKQYDYILVFREGRLQVEKGI